MGEYAEYAIESFLRTGTRVRDHASAGRPRTETVHGWACPCCGRLGHELDFIKGHHRDVHGRRLRSEEWDGCRLAHPAVVERRDFLKQGAAYRSLAAPEDNSTGMYIALMVEDGLWEVRDVADTVIETVRAADSKEGRKRVAMIVAEVAAAWSPTMAASASFRTRWG